MFNGTPCISGDILTLLSLFPGLLEEGLAESSCIVPEDTPEHTPEHSIVDPSLEVDMGGGSGVLLYSSRGYSRTYSGA